MARYLSGLLQSAAENFAANTAVVDDYGSELNYADLRKCADDIASQLTGYGISSGQRIGICMPKSNGAVATIYGILQAACAYVPVDFKAPSRRSGYIFTDCRVSAVVVDASAAKGLSEVLATCADLKIDSLRCTPTEKHLIIRLHWFDESQRLPMTLPDGIAYILYTSGSTGQPKGVIHTHGSARSFIEWSSSEIEATPADTFSSHAPFHFDLSIFDLFVSAKNSSKLVLIGEETGKQPIKLVELIYEHKITVWYSTPAILRLLIEFGKPGDLKPPMLRTVVFAGEVFPLKYLKELMNFWPNVTFFNFYGPTETNVCTYFRVPANLSEISYETLPIGHACSGNICRVVDPQGSTIVRGEVGELVVHGGSVMHGYWNLPNKNEDAFLYDDQERAWYRTGDIVVESVSDGYLFQGRRDRMVKRRGYRVELGEIESALYRHDSISEAAVVSFEDIEHNVQIVAFINWAGEDKVSIIALKKFCAENLISYMAPDQFKVLDTLPKTSTDKIDYQALVDLI